MSYYYLQHKKEKIRIATKPFAGGGEGNLHKIESRAYQQYVAKIYHPDRRTSQRAAKIKYLLNNPPEGQSGALIWVVDLLYNQNNQFVGFIMPFVEGEKLEVLCVGRLPRKLSAKWKRFDRENATARSFRLRVCFNLALAVHQIHTTNSYVLVDLKPDNIIIQPNGLISIVDLDSVEVINNKGKILFPAPVATPEYTPPEFYSQKKRTKVDTSWDHFGLAVIFYKLLFGIHPFAATAHAPYDKLVSLHQKIKAGLFVHHEGGQYLRIVPPPHQQFHALSDSSKQLFIQCFVKGHQAAQSRPTSITWAKSFLKAINDKNLTAHFEQLLLLEREKEQQKPTKPFRVKALLPRRDWPPPAIKQLVMELGILQLGLKQKPLKSAVLVLVAVSATIAVYSLASTSIMILFVLLLIASPIIYLKSRPTLSSIKQYVQAIISYLHQKRQLKKELAKKIALPGLSARGMKYQAIESKYWKLVASRFPIAKKLSKPTVRTLLHNIIYDHNTKKALLKHIPKELAKNGNIIQSIQEDFKNRRAALLQKKNTQTNNLKSKNKFGNIRKYTRQMPNKKIGRAIWLALKGEISSFHQLRTVHIKKATNTLIITYTDLKNTRISNTIAIKQIYKQVTLKDIKNKLEEIMSAIQSSKKGNITTVNNDYKKALDELKKEEQKQLGLHQSFSFLSEEQRYLHHLQNQLLYYLKAEEEEKLNLLSPK